MKTNCTAYHSQISILVLKIEYLWWVVRKLYQRLHFVLKADPATLQFRIWIGIWLLLLGKVLLLMVKVRRLQFCWMMCGVLILRGVFGNLLMCRLKICLNQDHVFQLICTVTKSIFLVACSLSKTIDHQMNFLSFHFPKLCKNHWKFVIYANSTIAQLNQ